MVAKVFCVIYYWPKQKELTINLCVQRPVHTNNDNWKDNYISVHTNGQFSVYSKHTQVKLMIAGLILIGYQLSAGKKSFWKWFQQYCAFIISAVVKCGDL